MKRIPILLFSLAVAGAVRAETADPALLAAMRASAMEGSITAIYRLARLYESGEGTGKPDPSWAVYWARTGAERDDPDCLNLLGVYYQNGWVGETNAVRAVELFGRAADLGSPKAWVNLGLAAELGHGLPRDPRRAYSFYLRAAEAGSPDGFEQVFRCHATGIGVPRDPKVALTWLVRAAEAGSIPAMIRLGDAYAAGKDVEADDAKAAVLYRQALEKNPDLARKPLIRLLSSRPGSFPGCREELARLCGLEAEASGDASFFVRAGELYMNPAFGPAEPNRALEWNRRAGAAASDELRQRIDAALFDWKATKSDADGTREGHVVFKGVFLGMPMETAAHTLQAQFARGGVAVDLLVHDGSDGRRILGEASHFLVYGRSEKNADRLEALYLSRSAMDLLFGSQGMPEDELRKRFRDAYLDGRPHECFEGKDPIVVEGRHVGEQKTVRFRSDDGWEAVFYGPYSMFDTRGSRQAQEEGLCRAPGSFGFRTIPSAAERSARFD